MKQIKSNEAAVELLEKYRQLIEEKPMRIRNAAAELGVSEGQLVASRVGEDVVRLKDDPQAILEQIETLGEVMALTRNDDCVHERKGVYSNHSFSKHGPMGMGLFVNPDIDLRLFMNHWKSCFAVQEESHGHVRKSIQFFDPTGTAIHKIYVTGNSNELAYTRLVADFAAEEQPKYIEVEAPKPPLVTVEDDAVDWAEFRAAWEGMKDTHDFYPMLRKFKVDRQQAFRHIGDDFAFPVSNETSRKILELARDRKCEIMVFVGNKGCIQIHTGPVENLMERDGWFNVLDPIFNLHLKEGSIANTWITKKPTVDGIVTAVEVFDVDGEIIASFFGKRKPGIPELELWREIVAEIPAEGVGA
jgi:putative hemin transport protein